ncbi:MAG: NAD-dependent epimerase/dehydratase family protein [Saprospiraceae bacterium]|nr:NAD-dependent epimerase/dehydratase family protein [Saprospiraceae bacterium]
MSTSTSTPGGQPVLITGATGFLGSYLLRSLLKSGHQNIRALRRSGSDHALVSDTGNAVEWVEADLLDPVALEEAMQGVRQVYHCAAMVSFDPREAQTMLRVNSEGTANVVNAALWEGVDKLVHVSSIAAIGRTPEEKNVTENTKWQRSPLHSNYAISKYLAEQEAWRGMAEGLNVSVVNPSVILGSGRWEDGPLQLFRLGWKAFPFYATGVSGFVDVRDVVQAMMRLMQQEGSGQRYIISAENLPFKTVQEWIAAGLGKRAPRYRVSPLVQEIAWRVEWLRTRFGGPPPLITRETARHANAVYYYDNSKSRKDLALTYTPVAETIAAVCRQFTEAAANGFKPMTLPV